MAAHAGLVGRTTEYRILSAAIADAAAGSPSAVVLHGEPGIGKTKLVTEVVTDLDPQAYHVLWARCLRFSSDGASFLPMGRAVSGWLSSADPETRAAVLDGAGDLAAILPEVGPPPAGVTGGRLIALLASVIDRIGALAPVVLVVDDLQWADTSSMDLLAHLIAGFHPGQQLVLLGTYRDTELAPRHRLHEWVADMRRMPRVTVRALARLDRMETAALVRRVLGADRPLPEVDEIFERAQGNPYLTELIASAGGADGPSLSEALLGTWHGLGDRAREVTQVLAVGGGPLPLTVLAQVVPESDSVDGTLREAVLEARAGGVLVLDGHSVWFRHPLLAEVISQTVDRLTAARIHDEYAAVLESAVDLNALVRAGLLALHHEQAGRPTEAFTASLRAADEAAQVSATAEESEHLQRACRLWPDVNDAVRTSVGDRAALLERATLAANRAGHFLQCGVLAWETISAIDIEAEPRRASRLFVALPLMLTRTDVPSPHRDDEQYKQAMQLAQPLGESDELAMATAWVAHSELWQGASGAQRRAESAVALAERAGSPMTVAWAHLVHSQFVSSTREGLVEAETAWAVLRAEGDVLEWALRAQLLINCLEGTGRLERAIEVGLSVLKDATADGAPVIGVPVAIRSAVQLVRRGRYQAADVVLRQVLAYRLLGSVTAEARAAATRLACGRGHLDAAREHVKRIEELVPNRGPLGTDIGDALVEYAWACGDPLGAAEQVLRDIPVLATPDPDKADERLVWGARAVADLAESGSNRTEHRQKTQALLAQIEAARGDSPPRFASLLPDDRVRAALAANYAAERSRCLGSPDQVERWDAARRASIAAGYPWEASWAAYQLGRALLRQRGRRGDAATALREAHRTAADLGARPLLERITTVATQARITLDDATTAKTTQGIALALEAALPGVSLTPREREVLAHVVAGRTYAEIARALFISEKTVSVHISNLLAKTGTSSRVELAALATSPAAGRRT